MSSRAKLSLGGAAGFLLALILAVVLFFRIYFVGGYGEADLLWNENEAYLFVHGERWGYSPSYLGYIFEKVEGYFGVVAPPDERRPFTTVIRVTPSGLTRYEEGAQFQYFTPLDDGLYAAEQNEPELWKWRETHFEKLGTEEQERMGWTQRLSNKDFSNSDGWSGLYSIVSKIKEQLPLRVGSLPVVVGVRDGQVSISILRKSDSAASQTLKEQVYYGSRPQRMSRFKYEQLLGH